MRGVFCVTGGAVPEVPVVRICEDTVVIELAYRIATFVIGHHEVSHRLA